MGDTHYLEVGVLNGASYFSAAYNNTGTYYGVDNWSKYNNRQSHIETQIKKYQTNDRKFVFFNEDSWKLDLSEIEEKINIFFYDGDHSYESQERYLRHFDKILADELILIVDDYNCVGLEYLEDATAEAIENSNFEKVYGINILGKDFDWHNGFYVAHLRRKNE